MNIAPFLDMTWGIIIYFMGVVALVYVVPLTVVVEAYFLRRILHLSIWRSILDASIMNIATGLPGALIASYTVSLVVTPMTGLSGEAFLGADYYTPTRAAFLLAVTTLMGTLMIVSIIVEGNVLRLIEKTSAARSAWIASVWCNVTSNLILYVIFVVFGSSQAWF